MLKKEKSDSCDLAAITEHHCGRLTDKIIAWGNLTALTMRILRWKKVQYYELSFLLQTSYFIKTWPSESRRFMIYHIWSFPQISVFFIQKVQFEGGTLVSYINV